jgi:general secretion pathway protein K
MNATPQDDNNSRGMILIVVLWAIAMMTVIVVALSAFSQKSLVHAGVETDRLRTEMALEAGIDIGAAMILARKAEDRVFLDGSAVVTDIGGQRLVEIAVMDAEGLVDINRADRKLIEALAASVDPAGAVAVVEGIMKLRLARPSKKPERPEQQQPPPPAFFSTAQLYALEGADAAIVDKLLPFISLYSVEGKINPMAAPVEVMQLIPGLTPEEAEILATARTQRQWNNQAVPGILVRHNRYLDVGASNIFVIGVKAISGRGLISGSRMQAVVIVDETAKVPFRILAWSW